jgi:hypothetical protein
MTDRIIDKILKTRNTNIQDIRKLKTIENLHSVLYFVNSKIKLIEEERKRNLNEGGASQDYYNKELKYYNSIFSTILVVINEVQEKSISNLSTSIALLTMREPTPQQEKNILRKLGDYLTGEDRLPRIKLRLLQEYMNSMDLPDEVRFKIRDMVIERFRRKGITVRRVDLPSRTVRETSLNRLSRGSRIIKTKRNKGKKKKSKMKKKTYKKK